MNHTNIDHEQFLLSEMMARPDLLDDPHITIDLFTFEKNRALFQTMNRAKTEGRPIDSIELRNLGNDDYPCIISHLRPTDANYEYYVESLTDLKKRRSFASMVRVMTEALDTGKTSDELAAIADGVLSEVADASSASTVYDTQALLKASFNAMMKAFSSEGQLQGIPTGLPWLDVLTDGFHDGELVIVGARPSAGKSAILLNQASAALRAGKSVGFISAEMPAFRLMNRLISDWGNVDSTLLRSGALSETDFSKIDQATRALNQTELYVDDAPNIDIRHLVSRARGWKRKQGIDILFVDYLQRISCRESKIPRHEVVADLSAKMKTLARELKIPVVVAAQLNREAESVEPTLANLKESGALEQDGDVILLLYPKAKLTDSGPLPVDVIVAKQRNGSCGKVNCTFERQYQRFTESG